MSFREQAIESLHLKAKAAQAQALASLEILLEHPAGIGDHSTEDLHNNLNEALSKLADADDRLDTLDRWFPL